MIGTKFVNYEIELNKLYTYNFLKHKIIDDNIIIYSIQPYSDFSPTHNNENIIIFVKSKQTRFVDINVNDLKDQEYDLSNIEYNFNSIKLADNGCSNECVELGIEEYDSDYDYKNNKYYDYHCCGYESY